MKDLKEKELKAKEKELETATDAELSEDDLDEVSGGLSKSEAKKAFRERFAQYNEQHS